MRNGTDERQRRTDVARHGWWLRVVIALGVVLTVALTVELGDGAEGERRIATARQVGPPQIGSPVAVTLRERNRSGRSGSLELTPMPSGGTKVDLEVSGPPDGTLVTAIVVGTCSSPGPVRFLLGATVAGRSQTTIPMPLGDLLSGKFSVRTAGAGPAADVVSCGEVVAG